MRAGSKRIVTEIGRTDVHVNNTGYGSYSAIEDVPMSEARRQFDVNVFGAARLVQLVLPHMRAPALREDRERQLDGRQDLHAARWLVSRHQVRGRSDQRLPADRDQAVRDQRCRDLARRDQDRMRRPSPPTGRKRSPAATLRRPARSDCRSARIGSQLTARIRTVGDRERDRQGRHCQATENPLRGWIRRQANDRDTTDPSRPRLRQADPRAPAASRASPHRTTPTAPTTGRGAHRSHDGRPTRDLTRDNSGSPPRRPRGATERCPWRLPTRSSRASIPAHEPTEGTPHSEHRSNTGPARAVARPVIALLLVATAQLMVVLDSTTRVLCLRGPTPFGAGQPSLGLGSPQTGLYTRP